MMNNKKWSGSMSQKKKKAPSTARRQAAEQDRISLKIRREVAGVLLIALGVILGIFIYFSYQAPFAGLVKVAFFGLFGVCGYAVPLVAAGMGVFLIIPGGRKPEPQKPPAGHGGNTAAPLLCGSVFLKIRRSLGVFFLSRKVL